MKKAVLLLCLVLTSLISLAQNNTRDIVYLKNGSIIKGTIIELTLNENIKIQTSDGSVYVYPFDQVEKIEKETTSNISSNTSSINISDEFKGMPFGYYHNDIFAGESYWGIGSHVFNEDELKSMLSDDLFETYIKGNSNYQNGQFLKTTGWILFVAGAALVGFSTVPKEKSLANCCLIVGSLSFLAGNVLIPIGYVKKGIGKGMISNVAEQCDAASRKSTLAFTYSPLGVNLIICF